MIHYGEYAHKNFTSDFLLDIITLLIMVSFLFLGEPRCVLGKDMKDLFDVSEEIELSQKGMNCSPSSLDSNHKFPKVIITDNDNPIIFFGDLNSNKLFSVELSDQGKKVMRKINLFAEIVFYHMNQIHLAHIYRHYTKKYSFYNWIHDIYFYELPADGTSPHFLKKVSVTSNDIQFHRSSSLKGIYPFDEVGNKFMTVWDFTKVYFHPLVLLTAHTPSFEKNFSLIIEDDEIHPAQRIERKGRFGVWKVQYAVSPIGKAHCVWVRTTDPGFSTKHDETICYSSNEKGLGWSEPLELYKRKKSSSYIIKRVSIACDNKDAYILWEDIEEGLFFAEIQNGNVVEKTKISPIRHIESRKNVAYKLEIETAVDRKGNVFALVNRNYSSYGHELTIYCRVSGKWLGPFTMRQEGESVENIDVNIDKTGIIHLAYLKSPSRYRYMAERGFHYRRLIPKFSKRE